jgi:uncharacterized membrane protein
VVAVEGESAERLSEGPESPRSTDAWSRWAPYALAVGLGIVYATISIARLHRSASMSWDTAIFEQAISGYAHFDAPIIDVKAPDYNLFGLHFSPALAAVAPFYRLFPTPVTLMVVQAVLVAISVAVIARAAIRHVGPVPGLAIGLAYGLSWGIQSGIDFDFHEVCFAMPFLALAGAAYLERDWPKVALWSMPLLLVKEDMGLTVAAIGGCLLLSGARRWGMGLAAGGLVGFVLATFVFIPMANPEGRSEFWQNYGSGGEPGAVVERVLSLPVELISPATKIETLLLLLAVTGFLALRSPFVLVALPTIGWRFLSDSEAYWSTGWHYSMTLMPIMFVALIDAIVRARTDHRPWLRTYASHAPAVVTAIALVLCLQFPFRDLVRPQTYDADPRAAAADEVMDRIPDGASVETDLGLLTELAGDDHRVYWLGNDNGSVTPDYVLLDGSPGIWGPEPPDAAEYAMALHPGTTYESVVYRDGYDLARLVP